MDSEKAAGFGGFFISIGVTGIEAWLPATAA